LGVGILHPRFSARSIEAESQTHTLVPGVLWKLIVETAIQNDQVKCRIWVYIGAVQLQKSLTGRIG
jgi:hypothetical protein